MKQTFFILRILVITLMAIIGVVICGCESDPILSPQIEVEEEAGGSYGNTNLPLNESQNAQDVVSNQETTNLEIKRSKVFNPKRF